MFYQQCLGVGKKALKRKRKRKNYSSLKNNKMYEENSFQNI